MSCIEPAVIEIPHRSWYCAGCTARGFGSPHEDCVVCERLNAPKTPSNGDDDGISPTNEETPIELEENSNCSIDDGLQLSKSGKNFDPCKICGSKVVDGEKLKTCSHSECPNKYYHSRCLTNKQLNHMVSFGTALLVCAEFALWIRMMKRLFASWVYCQITNKLSQRGGTT